MWRSDEGSKVLRGKQATVFQRGLSSLISYIDQSIEISEDYDLGIKVFDSLRPSEKLASLCEIAAALLEEKTPAPELTAILEASVAAVYHQVLDDIQVEIDFGRRSMRRLFVAALREICPPEHEIPSETSIDMDAWRDEIEICLDELLWDRDWDEEYVDLDAPPEFADAAKDSYDISDDYYTAVPPDPNAVQLEQIKQKLFALCRNKRFQAKRSN